MPGGRRGELFADYLTAKGDADAGGRAHCSTGSTTEVTDG